ncbi:hypothetical protein MW871_06415 [Flavobacterium sp. I-SCBP12n]|uniref:POTRA domain-containing protein n=1 Tax=Flavobacterium pygoscelis TaxID=2893176 RepID=A0A9X1XPR7_9FLAO|nr:hypothetical protein [Flavobacterium pygoscelis]MCK8141525.1 hypothetical protein [Flavobacterium pygoscelis]
MKSFLFFIFFFTICWNTSAQNFYLKIKGKNNLENKTIDSLIYNTKHKNIKSLTDEIKAFSLKLTKLGYIDNITDDAKLINDSIYISEFILGEKIKFLTINLDTDSLLASIISSSIKNNKIQLPYNEIDFFLKETSQKLEKIGYALAKLKLINIERNQNTLYADLKLETAQKRNLNTITIRYAEEETTKFPKGHLKQINKKYQNTIFNQKTVEKINDDFNKFSFVNQVKYPEILFTQDSTTIYVYLEKRKSNNFDGFLGFSNNENKKITLNGYLDLKLDNILGSGEELSVYWKSDGNNQKSFKGSLEIPYLFKSPVGIKTQLNIFRQDSTFQNTNIAIDLSYFINYGSRIYIGYHTTESSNIQNLESNLISDFNNSFITSSFEFTKFNNPNTAFPIKTQIGTSLALGSREIKNLTNNTTNQQFIINLNIKHNILLNNKSAIELKTQNYYMQSKRYLANELFRFGGLNSIRGFPENSLNAYYYSTITTEYRYLITPNLYIHSILDYSILKNKLEFSNSIYTENLIGLGAGIGINTKNGLFKIAVANGNNTKNKFETYNTILHISYNVKF